ncbi:MAG: hypothetical protein GTO40_07655 [Deltaproteobacteria bacterium]|nr:hypothetical protein [Deltaproteobacteria bacterium]
MSFAGVRTVEDILKLKEPLKLGSTGSGTTDGLPRILNNVVGRMFDIVTGFSGSSTIRLALQKREVQAMCLTWESMRVTGRAMLDAKGGNKLVPFIIHRKFDDPEVRNLPLVTDIIKGKDNLETYNAWVSGYEFFRPFSAPPGTPRDRVEILRKAFKATMEDPAFQAELKKANLPWVYVSPDRIEKQVQLTFNMSPKVKENLQFLIKGRERRR